MSVEDWPHLPSLEDGQVSSYRLSEVSEAAPGEECDIDECRRPATTLIEWDTEGFRQRDLYCDAHAARALEAHAERDVGAEAER